jgi:hypothetical protein
VTCASHGHLPAYGGKVKCTRIGPIVPSNSTVPAIAIQIEVRKPNITLREHYSTGNINRSLRQQRVGQIGGLVRQIVNEHIAANT